MPLHVPQLARKLGCLYQHHESVNTHDRLAECLGIASNNISTWVNGNEVRSRDLIPDKHVKRIADLYHVSIQSLEMDSLEQFKASLGNDENRERPWQQLLKQATTTSMIQLIPKASPTEMMLPQRGLVADDEEKREMFQLGELLYIHFDLDSVWANRVKNEIVSLLLLSKDQVHTSCLCPSSIAPIAKITHPNFLIPDKAPKKCLRIEGPRGAQSILALLTQIPLPLDLHIKINSEGVEAEEALDRIALTVSHNISFEWQLLRKDYEVI